MRDRKKLENIAESLKAFSNNSRALSDEEMQDAVEYLDELLWFSKKAELPQLTAWVINLQGPIDLILSARKML